MVEPKIFHAIMDITFEADDIDHAMTLLAHHFLSVMLGEDHPTPLQQTGEIKIEVVK